jgi:two-component system response regulator GlrR
MAHDWPGNIRELENVIEYAVAMTPTDKITEDYVLQPRAGVAPPAGRRLHDRSANPAPRLRPLKEAREAFERDYLMQVLSVTQGNVSQAAKLAGKYRADFYELLKKHDLKADDFKRT